MSAKLISVTSTVNGPAQQIQQGYQYGVSELDLKANEYRRNLVDWKSLNQAGVIGYEEHNFIVEYENAATEQRAEILANHPAKLGHYFNSILNSLNAEQHISHTLALMDEILERHPKNALIYKDLFATWDDEDSANALYRLLSKGTPFQSNMAASIICRITRQLETPLSDDEQRIIFTYLFEQLRKEVNEYIDTSGRNLQVLIKNEVYQERFLKMNGLGLISSLLNKGCKFQLQYQLIFCLWLLSYKSRNVEAMSDYNIVPTLIRVLEQSVKEKVSRITIATLRNNLEKVECEKLVRQNALHMLHSNLGKYLDITEGRRFEDPDIDDDIHYLRDKMDLYKDAFSTLDEYILEVESGLLQWGVIHDSETFWSENATKLNRDSYSTLRKLILLLESEDHQVQTVACHDLAMYLKHYPKGKWIVENLGGKHKIATILLQTKEEDLRYKALLCLQQLVFTNLKSMDLMIGKIQESMKKEEAK